MVKVMREFKGFQKGINLGGWISQFDEYSKEHFDTFTTEEDIKRIADFGFDHVRVPVDYILLEDEAGNPREDGYQYLESCRQWCEKYHLNMIVDVHECYGYSFDPLKKDDKKKFFYDEELQDRFLRLWDRIADRFKDHADMMAFEPLNEVVLHEVADAWNVLLRKYIARMRAILPDAYLIIGGVCYNSVGTVHLIDIPVDDHIVYNFHCYEPLIFTHQGAYWVDNMDHDFRIGYPKTLKEYQAASSDLSKDLAGAIFDEGISEIGPAFFEDIFAPAIAKAAADNVPLYCGEHGVIDLAVREDALRWLADIHSAFHKYNIGSALWNYREKDFGIADISADEVRDILHKIL